MNTVTTDLMTLDEILGELFDEAEDNGKKITPLKIGRVLVREKKNNEANVNWMKQQLNGRGITVAAAR